MPRDVDRVQRITQALAAHDLDAVIGSLPMHVLMMTGYWPVVGTSIAAVTREGRVGVVAPEDEAAMVGSGWCDAVQHFHAGSLDRIASAESSATEPVRRLLDSLRLTHARLGQ